MTSRITRVLKHLIGIGTIGRCGGCEAIPPALRDPLILKHLYPRGSALSQTGRARVAAVEDALQDALLGDIGASESVAPYSAGTSRKRARLSQAEDEGASASATSLGGDEGVRGPRKTALPSRVHYMMDEKNADLMVLVWLKNAALRDEKNADLMVPFVLVESQGFRSGAFVHIDLDESKHTLPLTTVYHQLHPVQATPYTFLQAIFGRGYPVGLLDEEKVLSPGKDLTAVGLLDRALDSQPVIKSSKQLPLFFMGKDFLSGHIDYGHGLEYQERDCYSYGGA
ncbi:hypothetical protein L7F22_067685 [Adiantum nelumboides]|nr:hypothetical protein [Adiantum nelumboides]